MFQLWSLSSLKENDKDSKKSVCGLNTWRAPHFAVLLSWPRHLKEGEEAEGVPVQVTVGAQAGLLDRRGSTRGVGEAQVVPHL